jgi:hypothetical protein
MALCRAALEKVLVGRTDRYLSNCAEISHVSSSLYHNFK